MTKNILPQIVYIFINIACLFCLFYYPRTRDEFYYLFDMAIPQRFEECFNSYLHINPRIGQWITNFISRSIFLKLMYGLVTFNSFFYMLYLLLFRKPPSFKDSDSMRRVLLIVFIFVVLIKFFGEMFFYTPFGGNYTFIMPFYLWYIYVMMEYFVYDNNILKGKKSFLFLILTFLLGIFTGMGNEHIPPVLISFTFLGFLYKVLKKKEWPSIEITVYYVSLIIGYMLLYFAPANAERYSKLENGNSIFHLTQYIQQFKAVLMMYRYYLPELSVATLISIFFFLFYKKLNIVRREKIRLLLFFAMGIITLPIVAYSPMIGLRLIFFTNTLLIICIGYLLFSLLERVKNKKTESILSSFSSICLVLFFSAGCFICYNAHENAETVFNEIDLKSKKTDTVVLEQGFDYFSDTFNHFNMNRRFLLENGSDYIDNDPLKDTRPEIIIKTKFHLKELSKKNEK
ncbi:DUF6056 family protein [Chryseobacterium sp.]|uniref:DUF6056 family protein n=1 Tax=Chryseobacterium sp. TaxID=1871047 RepID=UPI0012C21081|nr:DUF6056 family protein [Chryseobacterium sp.]MPS64178.1 hypothetical protein [Chryseobacterium sp.]